MFPMLNRFSQSSFFMMPRMLRVEIFVSLFVMKEKIFSLEKISLLVFFPCLKLFVHSMMVLYRAMMMGSFSVSFSKKILENFLLFVSLAISALVCFSKKKVLTMLSSQINAARRA